MNKTQTENLQLKNNSQMIKALKYIDWALLIFNVFVLLLFTTVVPDFIIGRKYSGFVFDFFISSPTFFVRIYLVLYCLLWCMRRYKKMDYTFVQLFNALFFVLAILFHFALYFALSNWPSF